MSLIKRILFFLMPFILKSEYTNIKLNFETGIPNIDVQFNNKIYNMIFDTSLYRTLIVSPKCEICSREGFDTNKSLFIKGNQTESKFYYNFQGDEYQDKVMINENLSYFNINFISFINVSFASRVNLYGYFALSFTNYKINTKQKMYALNYDNNGNTFLHIGGYNKNIIQNETLLKKYPINFNENKTQWYLFSETLYINENKTQGNQKLILDTSTNKMYIPQKFFFDNIDVIFPKEGNCQILTSGNFLCECDENYKKKFGNFKFYINDEILFINVTDYISFDSSITGSNCYVSININFNNEYWIAGNNVLNNYYSIFDIDNNTLFLYNDKNNNESNTQYLFIFLFVFIISNCVFFGGYFFYKKYIVDVDDEALQG